MKVIKFLGNFLDIGINTFEKVNKWAHNILALSCRVETPTKASYDTLAATSDISFWNEGRIGGHADVMVAPNHLKKSTEQFILKNLKYSVMVENVGDLIRLEQVSKN